MKVIKTHTGKIYVDSDKQLEFLTVGDYGKENNIKANFLGLTKEINGVKNTDVDLTDKWVATISTQDVTTSYTDYDVYREFEQPLVAEGWDVIVFVPSKEEDSDRITCGNALIANNK